MVDDRERQDEAPVWRDMLPRLVAEFTLWNDWASDGGP